MVLLFSFKLFALEEPGEIEGVSFRLALSKSEGGAVVVGAGREGDIEVDAIESLEVIASG